jgi:hypothetical protein
MEADKDSISFLTAYIKTLEDEMRNIRQRLEKLERNVMANDFRETSSTAVSSHIQKIEPIAKDLIKSIETSMAEKKDPLSLLIVPDIPQHIIQIKTVLDQLGY